MRVRAFRKSQSTSTSKATRIEARESPRAPKTPGDLAERRRPERPRARAVDPKRRELLAKIGHELRTPLNAVIGFTKLLHTGKAGPLSATQAEYVGDVLHSSNHLLKLMNDVLELAKFELGEISSEPAAVDAARVASEVCDALAKLAVSKQQRIRIEPDELGELWVDPRLLKQLIYQFLSNAIRFMPEEGTITLRLRADGARHFCIEIEDTGGGIEPADLDRLFQPFQKLEGRTRHGGSGLGLALAKRLAETLNGSVSVTSVVGKGSLFSARLPRRPVSSTKLRVPDSRSGTGS